MSASKKACKHPPEKVLPCFHGSGMYLTCNLCGRFRVQNNRTGKFNRWQFPKGKT